MIEAGRFVKGARIAAELVLAAGLVSGCTAPPGGTGSVKAGTEYSCSIYEPTTTDHSTDFSCPDGIGVRVNTSAFIVYRDGKTFPVSIKGKTSGEEVVPGNPPVEVFVNNVGQNNIGVNATVSEKVYQSA